MKAPSLTTRDNSRLSEHNILEMIRHVQQMYIREETPQHLFTHILESLLDLTESNYGFIGEVMNDEDLPYLRAYAISDIAWNEMTRKIYQGYKDVGHIDFKNTQTLFGHTLTSGETVVANSPSTHPRRGGRPEGHPPLDAYLGIPFFLGERMVGMIGLANRPQGFDEELVELLGPLLQTCAQLIDGYRTDRERRQALSDLRSSRQELARFSAELETLLKLCPDGFVAFDEQGLLNFANPAFLKMTGMNRNGLMSRSLQEFSRMLGPITDNEDYDSVLPANEETVVQIRLTRPRPTILTASFRRLIDGDGHALGHAFYFRDVTHEAEVDRMKTEFLSTAAHELRTPLASIHGFVDLLIHRDFDKEKRTDLLKTVHRQSTALVHMINELLDLARIEARAGKDFFLAPGDLRIVVEQCIETMAPTIGERHSLNFESPAGPLPVLHDPKKLSQALTNVLSNALKYSPDGGKIAVRTIGDPDVGMIGIEIADQGLGMSPDQVERIFERFYRSDQSGAIPGTGLGMSLVKEILDIHGGRVDIRSVPGEGSQVTLWLRTAGSG